MALQSFGERQAAWIAFETALVGKTHDVAETRTSCSGLVELAVNG